MRTDLDNIIKAIFEARYLKRIERSGTALLLGNKVRESVVEHSFYTSLFALVLHELNPKLNLEKLLIMCLIHDLEEVRTGDKNQINRLYFKEDPEIDAFSDMWQGSNLGDKLTEIHQERHADNTAEATASKDCDTLAELILEKEYLLAGNIEAEEWMQFTTQRLKTDEGKKVAEAVVSGRMQAWWEEIKNDIRKSHGLKAKRYTK